MKKVYCDECAYSKLHKEIGEMTAFTRCFHPEFVEVKDTYAHKVITPGYPSTDFL